MFNQDNTDVMQLYTFCLSQCEGEYDWFLCLGGPLNKICVCIAYIFNIALK